MRGTLAREDGGREGCRREVIRNLSFSKALWIRHLLACVEGRDVPMRLTMNCNTRIVANVLVSESQIEAWHTREGRRRDEGVGEVIHILFCKLLEGTLNTPPSRLC